MKAYQEVTNRTPAAIEAKLVEQAAEKLDELFIEREYLKKEIGLARETKEGTSTEEEHGETEMSKLYIQIKSLKKKMTMMIPTPTQDL